MFRHMSRTYRAIMLILAIIIVLMALAILFTPEYDSGMISYALEWDTGDAILNDDTIIITREDGAVITLTEAYLVSYRLQLIECEHEHGFFDGLFERIFGWMEPITVYAGHGDDGDSTQMTASYIENLINPQRFELGEVIGYEPNYCQLHYLIARPDSEVADTFTDTDMYATTLHMVGTAELTNGETLPIEIHSNAANGIIGELTVDGNIMHAQISDQALVLTVIRQLDTLFDTVDFATMDSEEQARAIVKQIVNHTIIRIDNGDYHAP